MMKAHRLAGVAAIAFGILTVISGGSALFGAVDMGAIMPFVLWFNFLAGFAYIIGGTLLMAGHRFALPVALAILIATAAVFSVFGWRALSGVAYELRTLGAMTLRTLFWVAMVLVALNAQFRGRHV